ncbi:MAG TPA: hypothetical protein VKY32_09485 [Flavobacterium sp.]|nr:hypothetical protein [Flavobacterium sp.]
MKKIVLSLMVLAGLGLTQAQAQESGQGISKNAIGLKFSTSRIAGGEITYQRALSGNNRLELDLGFANARHFSAVKISGLYEWVFPIEHGFYWYVGAGGSLGSWSFKHGKHKDDGAIVALSGIGGIEYHLKPAPFQFFIDLKPNIYITEYHDYNNINLELGIGARYKF